MLSKCYESTEVDRRTWLHVPSGTPWSTSSDTHQLVEIWKETSTKMFTHFKSDLLTIWTICAFRVMNPHQSSWAKQSSLKIENDSPKVPKQAEANRDGVINPQSFNFNQF